MIVCCSVTTTAGRCSAVHDDKPSTGRYCTILTYRFSSSQLLKRHQLCYLESSSRM